MSIESTVNRDEDRPEAIQQRPAVAPLVDIYENADELLVVAELPGVTQDGLSIQVEKSELLIDARRADAAQLDPGNDKAVVPDLRRSFVVPQGIDADKITADLKDGILRVHLPKAAALKPRQIPIKSS